MDESLTYEKDDAGTNRIIFFSRYCILSEDSLCQKQIEAIQNSVRIVSDTKSNVWKNNLESWTNPSYIWTNNLKSWTNPPYIWKEILESWKNIYEKDDAGTNGIIFFSRYSILSEDSL